MHKPAPIRADAISREILRIDRIFFVAEALSSVPQPQAPFESRGELLGTAEITPHTYGVPMILGFRDGTRPPPRLLRLATIRPVDGEAGQVARASDKRCSSGEAQARLPPPKG